MQVLAHAKVNLSLYITGRRADGYHTIDTVFQPLSLYDTLEMEPTGTDTLECSDPALENDDNLAIKALKMLREKLDFAPLRLRLGKRIPQQAGMGGGSADAAAVLTGAAKLCALPLSRPQLAEMAARLGADVSALLYDSPSRGKGNGSALQPLSGRAILPFLILKPPVSCPTAAMYRRWDLDGCPAFSAEEIAVRQEKLEKALADGDVRTIAEYLHNDFEQVLPEEAARAFARAKELLLESGALRAVLCGSGSAVFGLFENRDKRETACRRINALLPAGWQLFSCESQTQEEAVCSVILAAGGSGSRFGADKNKILLPLDGAPILAHSLRVFLNHPAVREIVIPCRKADQKEVEALVQKETEGRPSPRIVLCEGGRERQDSVRNALSHCREALVLIHDGARPFVKPEAIDHCLKALEDYPAVSLAVPSRDTVKLTNDKDEVVSTTDRARTWLVQTPQGFRRDLLIRAHEAAQKNSATDDCALMEQAGYPVRLIMGSYSNWKITYREDLFPEA